MSTFNRSDLMKNNWAIEHTHPDIDDEELEFLYGIADQLNQFYGKRGHWYDPVSFGHSVFSGYRPIREKEQPQERMASLPLGPLPTETPS